MFAMNQTVSLRRDALRRGGFTLIEVVIALAIFLFGALAIVRIFPPALGLIQNNEDQLTAVNLNRSTLAQFEKSPGLLPDAVYDDVTVPIVAATNFAGAVNGTASRNDSVPRNTGENYDATALGHFKSISRELHTVAAGTPTALSVVTRFPYEATPLRPLLVCAEEEVEGARMKADGSLDFTDATLKSTGGSFQDPTNPSFPLSNRNADVNGKLSTVGQSVFYVSYDWVENNNIQSVVDEPLIFPLTTPPAPASSTQTVQGRRGAAIKPVLGPVQLRFRRLKYILTANPNGSVPLPPNPPTGAALNDDYRGIVGLPVPATPQPPIFVAGETVSLDYTVKDWRWLVNNESPSVKPEGALATENYRAVNSPIRLFDKDIPLYTLLLDTSPVSPANSQPKNDQKRGEYTAGSAAGDGFPPSTFGDPLTAPVDVKKGQVIFDLKTMSSARSRVAYRTLDNWTQQLSVAARNYKPAYAGVLSTPAEPWRDYVDSDGKIHFRPGEAGKSVAVSYVYTLGATEKEVSNRILQIKERTIPSSGSNSIVAVNNLVAELALTDETGGDLSTGQLKAIRAVKGVSVQARTAWLDGNKYSQASSVVLRGIN